LRIAPLPKELGQAQIRQFGIAVSTQDDVRRLDVPVNDPMATSVL